METDRKSSHCSSSALTPRWCDDRSLVTWARRLTPMRWRFLVHSHKPKRRLDNINSATCLSVLHSPFSLLQYLNSQHTSPHHGLIKVKRLILFFCWLVHLDLKFSQDILRDFNNMSRKVSSWSCKDCHCVQFSEWRKMITLGERAFPVANEKPSKLNKLIPKTIGNRIRKRDCAWGCARGINTTWENLQIEKHKSVRWAERTPSWFVLFDLQIFSGGVYPPSATSRTISFSISNSFGY